MRSAPREAFAADVDLGSGHGSPTDVDWDCPGGLGSLPFLTSLAALTEEIRAEPVSNDCTGSITYALARYYQFDLLMWGIAPDIALEHRLEHQRARASTDASRLDTWSYLETWSYEYYSNFVLYHRYRQQFEKARPLLVAHYVQMGFPEKRAEEFADNALLTYVERAGGAFPSRSVAKIRRTWDAIVSLRNAEDATEYVKTLETAGEIRIALNRALLLRKTPAFISRLIDKTEHLNSGGESPLVYALGDTKLVELLLERGADINYSSRFGKTVLFYAIEMNDTDLLALLLKRGADVERSYVTSEDASFECAYNVRAGRTPLMHAAQHADVEVLKVLLEHGASLNKVDSAGYNATDYAMLGEAADNVAFLKSLGLRSNR